MKKFGSSSASAFTSPQSEKKTTDMKRETGSAPTIAASAIEHNPSLKADTAVGEPLQYREPAKSRGYCPDTNVIFPIELFAHLTTESETEHNKTSSSKYNIEEYIELHIELDFLYGRAMHMATQHHFVIETVIKKIIDDFKPFGYLSERKSSLPKWLKQMMVIYDQDNRSEIIDHLLSMDISDLSDTHDYLYNNMCKNVLNLAAILSMIYRSKENSPKGNRHKDKHFNDSIKYLEDTLRGCIKDYIQKSEHKKKPPDELANLLESQRGHEKSNPRVNKSQRGHEKPNPRVNEIHRWDSRKLRTVISFLEEESDTFRRKINNFCQELLKVAHFTKQFPQLVGKIPCAHTATLDQHFINLSFRPSSTKETYATVRRWLHESYPVRSSLDSKSFYEKSISKKPRNNKKRLDSFDNLIRSFEHLSFSEQINTLYKSVLEKSEVFRQQRVSFLQAQISVFITRLEQIETKLDAVKVDSPTSVIPTEQTKDMYSERTIKSIIKAVKDHIEGYCYLFSNPKLKPSVIIQIENKLSTELRKLRHACLTMHFCEKNIIANLLTTDVNQPLFENLNCESKAADIATACDLTLFKKTNLKASDAEMVFKNPIDHKLNHNFEAQPDLAQTCV